MPEGKKHHTEKFRACVEQVTAKGDSEESAYAICTASMQKAGEPLFEGAESRSAEEFRLLGSGDEHCGERHLHLLGATGLARTVIEKGKEWLVVPVVALMEGVIHAVNAMTPEFVPLATLQKAAASWNGKPVTLGHPKRNGKQCSANSSDILEAHGIGEIRNSRVDGVKLLQEAWIEKVRAQKLHPEMFAHLEANKTEEVSVGAFVVTDGKASAYNGKDYQASWIEAAGDHLAFLPGGRGACSVEMGCGTHRAAMHFVAAESIELLPGQAVETFTSLEGVALDQRIQAVYSAVYEKWPQPTPEPVASAYPSQVFDDYVLVSKDGEMFSVSYEMNDGKAVLGAPKKVKQQWVEAAAKYADCETCEGLGQVKDDKGQRDCPMCHGEGKMRAAAGARHSSSDMKMLQTMHDHAVSLGAKCDRGNFETAEETAVIKRPIKHEGGKFVLYSQDGQRRLAEHVSLKDAEAHDQAIQLALGQRKAS